MTTHPLWQDDYWLLIMQLYMSKPTGMKSPYSKAMVDLGINLHIPPKFLHAQMRRLRDRATPQLQRIWDTYSANPRKLNRDARKLHDMQGFGAAGTFYEGVDTADTFAIAYRPVDPTSPITPVMLVILLNLYYSLTPITMVADTPEVQQAARLMGITVADTVRVLSIYQTFDPILHRQPAQPTPLTEACRRTWQQFGAEEPDRLAAEAVKLGEYFK